MYSNSEWKRKLYAFSYACTKWGVDKDQTDRMNKAIEAARGIDTQLYEFCKQTAEVNCLKQNYKANLLLLIKTRVFILG